MHSRWQAAVIAAMAAAHLAFVVLVTVGWLAGDDRCWRPLILCGGLQVGVSFPFALLLSVDESLSRWLRFMAMFLGGVAAPLSLAFALGLAVFSY